jgi:hypothetical protein
MPQVLAALAAALAALVLGRPMAAADGAAAAVLQAIQVKAATLNMTVVQDIKMALVVAVVLGFLLVVALAFLGKVLTVLLALTVVAVVLVARLVQLTLPLTLPPPTVVTTVVAVAVWTTVLVALQRGLKTAASAQLESSTLPVTQGVFQALTRGTYNESLYPY